VLLASLHAWKIGVGYYKVQLHIASQAMSGRLQNSLSPSECSAGAQRGTGRFVRSCDWFAFVLVGTDTNR
jgi:hypothetical protein